MPIRLLPGPVEDLLNCGSTSEAAKIIGREVKSASHSAISYCSPAHKSRWLLLASKKFRADEKDL